jgi:hypothetical protein
MQWGLNGRNTRRLLAIVVAAAGVAAGCGGGDDDAEGADVDTAEPADDGSPATLPPASQHFDSDFAQVCRGTGAEWATPYDPAQAGPHKVVVLQGPNESDLLSISTGNTEWDVLFDAASDAYAEVELVACAIRVSEVLEQTCTGYENDGVETGNTVEYYSSTYEVTLRAATTAEVLGETTVEAVADTCPMLVFFDEGETTTTEYANVDANEFLLSYATT